MSYRRCRCWDDISLGSTVRVRLKKRAHVKRTHVGTYNGLNWVFPPGGRMVYMRVDGPGGQSWAFPVVDVEFVECLVEQRT